MLYLFMLYSLKIYKWFKIIIYFISYIVLCNKWINIIICEDFYFFNFIIIKINIEIWYEFFRKWMNEWMNDMFDSNFICWVFALSRCCCCVSSLIFVFFCFVSVWMTIIYFSLILRQITIKCKKKKILEKSRSFQQQQQQNSNKNVTWHKY